MKCNNTFCQNIAKLSSKIQQHQTYHQTHTTRYTFIFIAWTLVAIKHKLLEVLYNFTCGYNNTLNYKMHTTIQKRNTYVATFLTTKCKHLYRKQTYSTIYSQFFNSGSRSSSELSIPTTLMGTFLPGLLGCISSSIFRWFFNFATICCRNAANRVDLRRRPT